MNKRSDDQENPRDTIWAPWRIDYILEREDFTEGCFFCDAFEADREHWKDHKLITKNQQCGILLNKFPYNNGHALIAPVRHEGELTELREDEMLNVMNDVQAYCDVVRKNMEPDGFNVGMNLGEAAGAGVPDHLHVHVVPRWEGDTNFMPVTGDTHVIPQSLDELYELLKEDLQRYSSS